MTTTDLKPGDIVQHPEWGFGFIVLLKKDLGDEPASEAVVRSTNPRRNYGHDWDLTGWERVETVRPGHVQVRVDDLTPGLSAGDDEAIRRLYLAWRKMPAQRAESTPPADEQNASATEAATYQCPWCSTDVNFSVALNRNPRGGVMAWVEADGAHTCPPAQPDEPTEFGAKATVAQADGHIERWLNMHAPPQGRRGWLTWDARDTAGSTPGQSKWADWSEIIQRGTVTLGWDE